MKVFKQLTEILSCNNTSCKSELLSKDNQTILASKLSCKLHVKPYAYYCKTCKDFLCVVCCVDHLKKKSLSNSKLEVSKHHALLDLNKGIYDYLLTEYKQYSSQVTNLIEEINTDSTIKNIPDYQIEFNLGLDLIEKSKNEMINFVEDYYLSIKTEYLKLFQSLPGRFQIEFLEEKLKGLQNKILNKINLETNKENQQKDISFLINEIKNWNNSGLDQELSSLEIKLQSVKTYKYNSKKIIIPQVIYHHNEIFHDLKIWLSRYLSLAGSTENTYDQKQLIRISKENYYNNEVENYLANFDAFNEQLLLFSINDQTFDRLNLYCDQLVPMNHKLCITPDLKIYLTGGLFEKKPSKTLFLCSPQSIQDNDDMGDIPLIRKNDMIKGRVYQCVVYVNKKLYCLGGIGEDKLILSDCERYDEENDSWEKIANMSEGRYKFSACSFNDKFIFCFDKNMIEKYDIENDNWEVIMALNNESIAVDFFEMNSIQINPNQILCFGGYYELFIKEKVENKINKGLFVYNVTENHWINTGSYDHMVKLGNSQSIISNKGLYCLGEGFNKDGLFCVIRLENGKIDISNIKLPEKN